MQLFVQLTYLNYNSPRISNLKKDEVIVEVKAGQFVNSGPHKLPTCASHMVHRAPNISQIQWLSADCFSLSQGHLV